MKKRHLLLTVIAIIGFATITIAQTTPPYVPTNGLLCWYPFDGNGNDVSGNGNNATNTGATFVSDRCGASNSAAHFNGTSNYMLVSTPNFTLSENGSFTYSIWVKKQTQIGSSSGVIIMSGNSNAGNFISNLQGNSDTRFGTNMQQSAWTWLACPHTINVWDHYIATYENKIMKIYRNGVFQGTNTYPYTGASTATLPFYFARGPQGNYYNGDMDDIGVWNRVLTQAEITTMSQGGCDVVAAFTAIPTSICVGSTSNFYDNSSGGATTWDWNFTGGTPQTSNLQNPSVVYDTPGIYNVELIVSDGVSIDTLNKLSYINVFNIPVADAGTDQTICPGTNTTLTASGGVAYVWSTNPPQTTSSIIVNPTSNTTYYVTVVQGVCTDADTVTVFMAPLPQLGSDTTLNPGDFLILDAGGNYLSYLWSDGSSGQYLTINNSGTYWVQVLYPGGCISSDTINISVGYGIQGNITYSNVNSTPINNTKLLLTDDIGGALDSVITGANGDYVFANLSNGNYYTVPRCTKPWGGVNSTDALAVMKHFVGLIYLYGLNALAADVNQTIYVNSADALMIQRRYLGMISSFPAGDWIFEENFLPLFGNSIQNDFIGLCFGDVNGSYHPPTTKQIPSVVLELDNTIILESETSIDVPIIAKTFMEIAAISLELLYPADLIIIEDVTLANNPDEEVLFSVDDGVLRISWYSLESYSLMAGDIMLNLNIRINKNLEDQNDYYFILGSNSELAGPNVDVLDNIELSTPKLSLKDDQVKYYLGHNYPNPFISITEIEYNIEEGAFVSLKVYNTIGEEVAHLVNKNQEKGIHKVVFDATNLKAGNYFYSIRVTGSTSSFIKSRMMQVN